MVKFFTRQIEQKARSNTTALTLCKSCYTKNDFKTLKPRVQRQLDNVINGISCSPMLRLVHITCLNIKLFRKTIAQSQVCAVLIENTIIKLAFVLQV
ncbi:hypothetical protein D3C85_1259220 [compost metagenome]